MRRKPGTRLLLTVDRELLKQFHAAAQKHGLQTDEAADRAIRLWLSASPLEKKFPAAARSGFVATSCR